jgi:F-type H+-transporting ATPase subunit b
MATHTQTEAPGGPRPFPQFQVETFPSQLVWLAITFVALYLIASRLALPRVGAILDARRDRIAGDLAEAQRLKTESDTALAAYEQSLADARNRAQALVNRMRERQHAEAEAARKALEQSLNAKVVDAERVIAASRAAAMRNVHAIAADAAGAIVERMIGRAPQPAAIEAAVTDVLKG